jgi:hypothetical protein
MPSDDRCSKLIDDLYCPVGKIDAVANLIRLSQGEVDDADLMALMEIINDYTRAIEDRLGQAEAEINLHRRTPEEDRP